MPDDLRRLELTFPGIPTGERETPPNLKRLLFKGGASTRISQVDEAIQNGLLGDLQSDRMELVLQIHEYINGELVSGGSPATARRQIIDVSRFFGWADTVGGALNILNVEKMYRDWSDYLWQRVWVLKDLKERTAYNQAVIVGRILDRVLDREKPIVRATRLRNKPTRKTPQGAKEDKQNLSTTFAVGRLLQDICDATPLSVIWGPPLIRIPLQQGGELVYKYGHQWIPEEKRRPSSARKMSASLAAYEANRSIHHPFRRDKINMRIQAEMLMFIGQTGINMAQVLEFPLRGFSYSSDIDGYKVREYKSRRKGEVLFEIFSEYRGHFERYLEWRRNLFPDTEKRLFPLIKQDGVRKDVWIQFTSIKTACKRAGLTFTPPSSLRGTRVNWLLRRTSDPDMAAEMVQHHKQTLLNVYETPSMQRAISEIIRFHLSNDPSLAEKALLFAVAPGQCDGIPVASPTKPPTSPAPDCQRPSGCLWCEHHRDIDSLEYVWSLACFRHLKILELSRILPIEKERTAIHPVEHVIARLSEKLSWFRESNAHRREWVEESLARVEEGWFHEQWDYLIEAMEGASR